MSKCICSFLKTVYCFFSPNQLGEISVNPRNVTVSADRLFFFSPSIFLHKKYFYKYHPISVMSLQYGSSVLFPSSFLWEKATQKSRELCSQAAFTSRCRGLARDPLGTPQALLPGKFRLKIRCKLKEPALQTTRLLYQCWWAHAVHQH